MAAASPRAVYPVVFLDAIICKVRDDGIGHQQGRAHLAVGVDVDGKKRSSGFGSQTTEGAKSGCG